MKNDWEWFSFRNICLSYFRIYWANEVVDVLKEWHRAIGFGGVIRIAVPDFEAIVQEYINNNDLSRYLGLLYGGQTYEYNFHYVTFDFNLLKAMLEKAGFNDVQRYDWNGFLPKNYDDYSRSYIPHLDFKNGRLMSLNVIAHK